MFKPVRMLLLIPALTWVTACSVMKPVRTVTHTKGHLSLNVELDPDLNQDAPLAVDVITVSGKKTVADVSTLTAQAYFQKRASLKSMHPSDLQVYSWEWVPGQQVAPVIIPGSEVYDEIFLFANYSTPGSHAAALPKSGSVTASFGPEDFKVEKR